LKLKIGTEAQSYAVAFSPDGKTIVSDAGSFDSEISVWDAQTGKLVRTLTGHDGALSTLVFSPDGKLLAGAESAVEHTVQIWDLDSGEIIQTLKLPEIADTSSVAFSPDGKLLMLSGNYGDGSIRLVDTTTWQIKRTILASKTIRENDPISNKSEIVRLGVICAQFSADGKTLAAVVDQGRTLKFWNTQSWMLRRATPLKVYDMVRCAFSPDLKLMINNYQDNNPRSGSLDVWDTVHTTLHSLSDQQGGNPLAYSPDGKSFLVAMPNMVLCLREVSTGKLKVTFKGHMNDVSSAAFSRDGQTLLTGSLDGTVRLWVVKTGEVKRVLVLEDAPGRND
jgi:Tol biopolymer transport system component